MVKKTQAEVVEAEIIDAGGAGKRDYTATTFPKRPNDPALVWVWSLSIFALFMSIIPIIGWFVALIALVASFIKKIPPVLPIIALIISSFISGLTLFIWLILKAIF